MKEGSVNRVYQTYWTALRDRLKHMDTPFPLTMPPARDRYTFAIGRTGFKLEGVVNSQDKWVRVQVALVGPKAAPLFPALQQYSFEIEPKIPDHVEWAKPGEVPFARVTREESDPLDRTTWKTQHDWIANRLVTFHSAFSPIIRRLPIHKD